MRREWPVNRKISLTPTELSAWLGWVVGIPGLESKWKWKCSWYGIHCNGRRRGPIAVRNYHKNRANSVSDFKVGRRRSTRSSILAPGVTLTLLLLVLAPVVAASFLIFPSYALSFLLYLILIRISHFTIKLIGHAAAELHPSKRDTRLPGLSQQTSSCKGCTYIHRLPWPLEGGWWQDLIVIIGPVCTWGLLSVANLCKYWLSMNSKAVQLVPRYLLFCSLNFEYSILGAISWLPPWAS